MTVIDRRQPTVGDGLERDRRHLDTAPSLTSDAEARFIGRARAWMLVLPVDFVLMVAPVAWRPYYVYAVLAMALLGSVLLAGGVHYRARLHLSVLDELPTILSRLLTSAGAVAFVILWLHQKAAVIIFLETACQAIGLVVVGRFITTRVIAFARRRGITTYRTVLIGSGELAAELAQTLNEHPAYGLRVDGFVDDGHEFPAAQHATYLGRLADLDDIVAARPIVLLVADGNFDERLLIEAVRSKACQSADLLVVPRLHHFHTQTGYADHIGSIPILRIRNPNLHWSSRLTKRVFDIIVAAPASIVLLPLMIGAAVAVRLELGPGVIFRQVRVGRDGEQFHLLKFRTMRALTAGESRPARGEATVGRVGPIGRFLRCTSIDELPQLWNILRGDMTLVGPRPEEPQFVQQFSMQFDRYAARIRVEAGLTGLAQVSGLRGDTSIADRARYDNFYIENWSLWLDIKIILRTFRAVFLYREK